MSLLFGSGGERCNLALAVEVPAGNALTLSLRFGPGGNALILGLLFGPGGEHCDLALAVEVWRRRQRRRRRRRRDS